MSTSAPSSIFQDYERQMAPVRRRSEANPTLAAVLAPDMDPLLLELFLLYFVSMGVRMTEPVEGWIRRAAQSCEDIGYSELARALRGHAAAEAGHNLMMVRDTHAMTARLNASHRPSLDAEKLLAAPPGHGATRYIQVHEAVIAGPTPFAQVAVEYEIEMLPVRYGPTLVKHCVGRLGKEILGCLSFITEHIELDVGHTKFNSRQLETVLERNPEALPTMVAVGTDVLDAYSEFLSDCLEAARQTRSKMT
jgi:hypothetical protein